MKWIKTFESMTNENIIQDCKDILLELQDSGFTVNIRPIDDQDLICEINIYLIGDRGYKSFTFNKISDVIYRLNNFLELNNKGTSVYEDPEYTQLNNVVKKWGNDYIIKNSMTIYIEK